MTAPAEPPPAVERPRRSLGKRLAFMLVPAVLVIPLLEGGLRLAGLPTGLVSSMGKCWADAHAQDVGPYRPSSRATIAYPVELMYHPSFNALGLRGPEVPRAPTPGLPRILCVGDSTTFGFYVEDADTYPVRLQERLLEKGARAEVLNGGCGRWTITDETRFLADHALSLEPAIVVLLFCANDLEELDLPSVYDAQEKARREGESLFRRILHASAIHEAHLRLRVAISHDGPADFSKRSGPPGDHKNWDLYASHLRELAALVEKRGARLLVGAFPGFVDIQENPSEFERRLPPIVAALGAADRVGYVDLYAAFRAHQADGLYHLPIDSHPTSRGNDLMAQVISQALVERGWLAKP